MAVGALSAAHLCHHQRHLSVYEHTYDLRALSSSAVCDLHLGHFTDVPLHCRDDSKNAHTGNCQGECFLSFKYIEYFNQLSNNIFYECPNTMYFYFIEIENFKEHNSKI